MEIYLNQIQPGRYRGTDGRLRVAKIQAGNTTLKKQITKLCPAKLRQKKIVSVDKEKPHRVEGGSFER